MGLPTPERPRPTPRTSVIDRHREQPTPGSRSAREPQAPPPMDIPADPRARIQISKAQRLFEQAMEDKASGDLVSARMNVKLALTFDPANRAYLTAFRALDSNPAAQPRSKSGLEREARSLFDQARKAEQDGRTLRAIELLEKALEASRHPLFLNRLARLLAEKERDYKRAIQLLEEAVRRRPDNQTYARNLSRVQLMERANNHRASAPNTKGGSLLKGLFGRLTSKQPPS